MKLSAFMASFFGVDPINPIATTAGVCSISIDSVDAAIAGQTMRSIARARNTPIGVRPLLDRVGTQLARAGMGRR